MKKDKKFLSRGTVFNIVAVGIFAFGIFFCYCLYKSADNIVPTNNRIAETLYTVCHPLKEQYDIKDYIVTPFGDGSMGIEYIINNPELAFDIVREIDTLRKDSIYLSKALIHIRIRSAQSDGVDFRVDLPGELGYQSKRDVGLYRSLKESVDRKVEEQREEIKKKHPESEGSAAEVVPDTVAAPTLPVDAETK